MIGNHIEGGIWFRPPGATRISKQEFTTVESKQKDLWISVQMYFIRFSWKRCACIVRSELIKSASLIRWSENYVKFSYLRCCLKYKAGWISVQEPRLFACLLHSHHQFLLPWSSSLLRRYCWSLPSYPSSPLPPLSRGKQGGLNTLLGLLGVILDDIGFLNTAAPSVNNGLTFTNALVKLFVLWIDENVNHLITGTQ